MSQETDKFIEYLRGKINSYRLEMLTDFYEDPQLLLGDGLRSFDILTLLQPVVLFGPTGYPLPAGSLWDSGNSLPRFVATSRIGRDVIQDLDTRVRAQNDSTPEGIEVIAEDTDANWHSGFYAFTLAGGTKGATSMVGGTAGKFLEVDIYDILIRSMEDAVPPVSLNLAWAASAGATVGQTSATKVNYVHDVTGAIYDLSNLQLHYVNGKRILCTTANAGLTCAVTGGIGSEKGEVMFNYRYLDSIT